jgi:hypothetical protein
MSAVCLDTLCDGDSLSGHSVHRGLQVGGRLGLVGGGCHLNSLRALGPVGCKHDKLLLQPEAWQKQSRQAQGQTHQEDTPDAQSAEGLARLRAASRKGRSRVSPGQILQIWAGEILKKVKVGVWWKGCRKQLPKAPFSAAFSEVSPYWRSIRIYEKAVCVLPVSKKLPILVFGPPSP